MNNRQTGTYYEREAVRFLKNRNVQVLEVNFRCRQGEIDIIGYEDTCLIFVEVKARDSKKAGSGAEAVNFRKQCKICRVADYYRMLHGISDFAEIRYDCVIIDQGEIVWVKNAFGHAW